MEALSELKNKLSDLEFQMREVLKDALCLRRLDIDKATSLYQEIRKIQEVADQIEINDTE